MSGEARRGDEEPGPGYLVTRTAAEVQADGYSGLAISCRCGRRTYVRIESYVTRRLHPREPVAFLVPRLICARCGRRARLADIRMMRATDAPFSGRGVAR